MSSYLALEDGPPRFDRDSSCPGLLGYSSHSLLAFRIRDSHPLRSAVPGTFRYAFARFPWSPATPQKSPPTVWALPVSLAATSGISFDFSSSRYLDVSVPWVGFPFGMTRYDPRRVSPFGHPRFDARLQLPEAFRSLPRPSSPAHA
jgi:hypothetical protein